MSSRFACMESFPMCLRTYQSHPMARCCQHRKKERSEDRKRSFRSLKLQILLSLASSWIPLVALALECIQLGLHSSRSSQHAVFHRPKIQKLSVYQTCFSWLPQLFTAACLLHTTTIVLKTAVHRQTNSVMQCQGTMYVALSESGENVHCVMGEQLQPLLQLLSLRTLRATCSLHNCTDCIVFQYSRIISPAVLRYGLNPHRTCIQ
jgi:hypothetical protein